MTIDVPKDKQNFIIDVKAKITDRELTDYGDKGSSYQYDVKSKKWVDSLHPFNERTPSLFITLMISAWQEVNGELPKKIKRNLPQNVEITTEQINHVLYDEGDLKNAPDYIMVTGSENNKYIVNITQLSCTCMDFKKRRENFPERDIRRICKHIAKQIVKNKLNTELTENKMIRAFIRKASVSYKGVPLFDKIIHVNITEPIKGPGEFFILYRENVSWLDIINFTERTYIRNGYNIKENRWAYGKNHFPQRSKIKYNLAIQQAYKDLN